MKPNILYKGWVNIYFHNGDFITDGKIYLTKDIAKKIIRIKKCFMLPVKEYLGTTN